ncbi:MAG: transcriptional regulator, partial [Bacteroidota bacterium]
VVVYYDPASIALGSIVDASTPVFDQTGLLSNNVVRSIAVDGGNRKWIGTENGVFLVAENGDDVIHHFTKENSPLLSNRVNDVAIDQSTGEVFIATDKGLISYQGDATLGDRDCNDVLVYPNPVRPDYEGTITIRGAARGSAVKITTVSGMLVRELESQGSTATWDGLDTFGNPVRSGIYLALIADRNGEKACIGKFSVIR